MTTTQPQAGTNEGEPPQDETVFETSPTIKPVLIWFGIVALLALVVLLYLIENPALFGDPKLTEIVYWVLLLVFGVTLLRFAVKMFILTRTRYIVTDDGIRREFELIYRRHGRELPMEKIRGIEFNQSRIQSLLGYGSLSFLAGGTNQSLGFVEFEHIVEPDTARAQIRQLIRERTDIPRSHH